HRPGQCMFGAEWNDNEGPAILFADVEDRADVGVIQRGCGASLAPKPLERSPVSPEPLRKELESNGAIESDIFSGVDDAHSTAAEPVDDAIVRECVADDIRRVVNGLRRGFLVL